MRVSFPRGGLSNLPRSFALLAMLMVPMSMASADIPPIHGGEGGWINVPGGGGGSMAKAMQVVKIVKWNGELYGWLFDPVEPQILVASLSSVIAWASGNEALAVDPELEASYKARVNGKETTITVRVNCKNKTHVACASELARLLIAMQEEIPPIGP